MTASRNRSGSDDGKGEKARSVRLPERLWTVLDTEAARCSRSSTKQLEALIRKWLLNEDVEISESHPKSSKR